MNRFIQVLASPFDRLKSCNCSRVSEFLRCSGLFRKRKNPKCFCSICMGEVRRRSFADNCGHEFCYKCLQKWSMSSDQCPICRARYAKIIYDKKSDKHYKVKEVPRGGEGASANASDVYPALDTITCIKDDLNAILEVHRLNLREFAEFLYIPLNRDTLQLARDTFKLIVLGIRRNFVEGKHRDLCLDIKREILRNVRNSTYIFPQTAMAFNNTVQRTLLETRHLLFQELDYEQAEELMTLLDDHMCDLRAVNSESRLEYQYILANVIDTSSLSLYKDLLLEVMQDYHSVIWQSLSGRRDAEIERILLRNTRDFRRILDHALFGDNIEKICQFLVSLIADKYLDIIIVH